MVDLLGQAVDWVNGMRAAHLSRSVTYVRGGESVELLATLGSTLYEVTDEAGATVQAKATDFIVSADELVLGGEPVEPQVGDSIHVAAGGKVLVFEVLELAGAGHYRPCDPYGAALRIHTKQVE